MMNYFRDSHNHPPELQKGVRVRPQLKKLESEIGLALQKLMLLKRTFPVLSHKRHHALLPERGDFWWNSA